MSDSLTLRIVAVIEALAESEGPVGPRGLAREVNIDRSAVGRILGQLADVGVAVKKDGGYVPGARLLVMGRALASKDGLERAAVPILRDLVDRYNETCYVCVRRDETAVHLYKVESTNAIRYVVELGTPFPLYAGAPGRAILTGLSDEEVRRILERTPPQRITPLTLTDPEDIVDQVRKDRRVGYTVSVGERIEGGLGISAPFFDHTGTCVGSIVFTSPLLRVDETRVPEFGQATAAAAAALSARLGYRRAG